MGMQPPPAHRQSPRKRKHEDEHGQPSRHFQIKTPSKTSTHPWEIDPYESPSMIRNLFTPSKRTAIGPTPQKDGQVLGIFDLLEENRTPTGAADGSGATLQSIHATPRKFNNEIHETPRHAQTPSSKGKLPVLNRFATPLASPHPNEQTGITPSSISKLHFSTPSFLRRDSQWLQLPAANDNDENLGLSPEPIRVPRKPLIRGLSTILAGLRKIEEEAADEDLDALHEMEDDIHSKDHPDTNQKVPATKGIELVVDSQPRLPLGGFDDEAMFDSEPEMEKPTLGRDGKSLQPFKKKGLKRTTRLVKMKPSRSKPQAQLEHPQDDSEDELTQAAEMIPETQADHAAGFTDARNFDSDSQSEYTASEGGTRYRRPNQGKRKDLPKDGKIKAVSRKANVMVHQNFKRLKLRNSGAKGGPAHNSRFRRKR